MDKLDFYTDYKSEKYSPGSIFFNNGDINDKIEILGKAVYKNESKHFYIIKFLNTGYIKRINSSQLSYKIIDPLAPSVYGKGIIGVGKYKANENYKHTKEGTLWYNMLTRCYSEIYHQNTPTYITCEVCDRWLNFQLFCEDLPKLENYDKWLLDSFNWVLDKDTKVKENKIYSPDTCKFITNSENTIVSNISKSKYLAISPTGEQIEFTNMRIFAENHNMTKGGISSVITGKQKTHRGWKFKKIS